MGTSIQPIDAYKERFGALAPSEVAGEWDWAERFQEMEKNRKGQFYPVGAYVEERHPPPVVAASHPLGERFVTLRQWFREAGPIGKLSHLISCCTNYHRFSQVGNLRKMNREIRKVAGELVTARISSPRELRYLYERLLREQQRLLLAIFALEEAAVGGLNCRKGCIELLVQQSLQMVVHCVCLPFIIGRSRFGCSNTYAMGPLVIPITELIQGYNEISGALKLLLVRRFARCIVNLPGEGLQGIKIMAQLVPIDNEPLLDNENGMPRSCNASLAPCIRLSLYHEEELLAFMDLTRMGKRVDSAITIERQGDEAGDLRGILGKLLAEIEEAENIEERTPLPSTRLTFPEPLLKNPGEILPLSSLSVRVENDDARLE